MKYFFIELLLLITLTAHSQTDFTINEKKLIQFFTDSTMANSLTSTFNNNKFYYKPESDYLIKIKGNNDIGFRQQNRKSIRRQLSNYVYIISIRDSLDFVLRKTSAEYILPSNNNWKLSPALISYQQGLSPIKKYVFLIKVNSNDQFIDLINANSEDAAIESVLNDEHLFKIIATGTFIKDKLLPSRNVLNIDSRSMLPKEETVIPDFDNSVNGINRLHAYFPEFNGNNLTVSIKENLFDTFDIDFVGRYKPTNINSLTTSSHANNMATLIGGGGNSFYTGKGVSNACNLSSSSFAVLLPEDNSIYLQYGISVQNHSYGVGIENFYGSDAAAYDASMQINPYLIHIFSSGNIGTQTSAIGQYSGIPAAANLTGSFKMAKNIITVGSVDSFYNVPVLSSRGPAFDGRIKPELVAYGNDGSSGAAAITSGVALVLQDAYSQKHGGQFPSSELVKAVLINSADDVGSAGIDFVSGYGSVNAYQAVSEIISGNFFNGSVKQNENKTFTITVPANVKKMKITLVWNDVSAQANAFTALVNDLDLLLQNSTTSETWLPWVLNSFPNSDSLIQLPKRMRDSLNVVEQISIDNPLPGAYTVSVKGFDIPSGSQDFYIAYSWDTLNTFQFSFPAKTDHFISGVKNTFRWQNNFGFATGKLEYSLNNGSNWILIDAAADISKPYYQWVVPDTFCIALARITIGPNVYTTDTFNFSKQLYPKVGFNCEDSLLISWKKTPGIERYQIFQLGQKYLEPINVLTDTSIIIHHPASLYYAVAPLFSNNYNGVKSYTFNYTTQGVGCYIKNFLADLQTDNTALLLFELGSIYQVDKIIFQKLTGSGWKDLQTVQPVTDLQNNYTDKSLRQGPNIYRAIVVLMNGERVVSNEATVYFFAAENFVLYPNPVFQGQMLTVISNNSSNNTFLLYDIAGKKMVEQTLNNTREAINISTLAKGVYIVVILKDHVKIFMGKVVIN